MVTPAFSKGGHVYFEHGNDLFKLKVQTAKGKDIEVSDPKKQKMLEQTTKMMITALGQTRAKLGSKDLESMTLKNRQDKCHFSYQAGAQKAELPIEANSPVRIALQAMGKEVGLGTKYNIGFEKVSRDDVKGFKRVPKQDLPTMNPEGTVSLGEKKYNIYLDKKREKLSPQQIGFMQNDLLKEVFKRLPSDEKIELSKLFINVFSGEIIVGYGKGNTIELDPKVAVKLVEKYKSAFGDKLMRFYEAPPPPPAR